VSEMRIHIEQETADALAQQARQWHYSKREYVTRVLEYAAAYNVPLFINEDHHPAASADLTFADMFAGIGGIRLAMQAAGGRCVFSCEWDKWCQKTYQENFGEQPWGDIRKLDAAEIPDHDILTAGFPCQPFSIAGVSKKKSLGREHGFRDVTQGTLFFDVLRIIEAKRPKAFLLENVKNLRSHDKGRTFRIILDALHGAGYSTSYQVIDARHWVPQHRERIFIAGFDKEIFGEQPEYAFPEAPKASPRLTSILDKRVPERYTLSDKLWAYLQAYALKHKARGNGFGFGLCTGRSVTRTLSARYYKDGSEILISQRRRNPRRLTPEECARLMGFPSNFIIPVSDTQAYKQFGNSVVVPVVTSVALQLRKAFAEHGLVANAEPVKEVAIGA
jgi:DNA (cytosine-5)-methyltransferase 1